MPASVVCMPPREMKVRRARLDGAEIAALAAHGEARDEIAVVRAGARRDAIERIV